MSFKIINLISLDSESVITSGSRGAKSPKNKKKNKKTNRKVAKPNKKKTPKKPARRKPR